MKPSKQLTSIFTGHFDRLLTVKASSSLYQHSTAQTYLANIRPFACMCNGTVFNQDFAIENGNAFLALHSSMRYRMLA